MGKMAKNDFFDTVINTVYGLNKHYNGKYISIMGNVTVELNKGILACSAAFGAGVASGRYSTN
jgi:hypothetical protein